MQVRRVVGREEGEAGGLDEAHGAVTREDEERKEEEGYEWGRMNEERSGRRKGERSGRRKEERRGRMNKEMM